MLYLVVLQAFGVWKVNDKITNSLDVANALAMPSAGQYVRIAVDPNVPAGPSNTSMLSVSDTLLEAILVAVQLSAGSTGSDFSANAPAIPNVGANFGSTGLYANYKLLTAVPANKNRAVIEVAPLSSDPVIMVRDDGNALTGSAPTNASIVSIGRDTGSYKSATFKGRLQVYSPASGAVVSVTQD